MSNKIEVLMNLNDEFSKKFKDAINELDGGSKKASSSLGGLDSSIVAIDSAMNIASKALQAVKKAFDFATESGVGFQANMSKLGAITNASSSEMGALSATAKNLGENSRNSASQVGELQIELAKLGFTADQINAMAGSVNNLSIATGEDLANSSEVVGSVLRQFSLDAEEATIVVDIMAQSFSSSSLDLNKFKTAMGQLGSTSSSMNFTLAQTTAVLGKMVDSGLRSETAATGLRNILGGLRDENGKLSKVLGGNVNNFDDFIQRLSGVKIGSNQFKEALEAVGVENQAVFINLIKSKDSLKEFSLELDASQGRAKKMADIMGDNVDGALANMNSSLEALAINLFEAFDDQYKVFLQELTIEIKDFSQWVIRNSDVIGNWAEQLVRGITGSINLFNSLKDSLSEVNYIAQIIALPFKNAIAVIGKLGETAVDFVDSITTLDFSGFGDRLENRLGELKEAVLENQNDIQLALNATYTQDVRKSLQENETKAKEIIDTIKRSKAELKELEKPTLPTEVTTEATDVTEAMANKKREMMLEEAQFQLELKNTLEESEYQKLKNEEEFLKKSLDERLITEKEYAKKSQKVNTLLEKNKTDGMKQTYDLAKTALTTFFGDNKIIASGIALVDTYVAANKALASAPPPINYVNAGIVTASGLLNVGKINGIAGLNEGGVFGIVNGVGTQDNVNASLTSGEAVLRKDVTNRLGEDTINGLNNNNAPTRQISNSITYSPVINITGGENKSSIVDMLKNNISDFADFFNQEMIGKDYVNGISF